jgi:CBS domain-containing protein
VSAANENDRLGKIVAWFLERDILLGFDGPEGDVCAVMVPADSRIAPAGIGRGATKLEAAENAKVRFEAGDVTWPVGASLVMPYDVLHPVGASLVMPYQIHVAEEATATEDATVSARIEVQETGTGTDSATVIKDDDETPTEAAELDRARRIATDYGWRIGCVDEPDGSVTAYLMDEKTGEVLKSALGTDFHDAVLGVLADTYPPTQEGRAG